MNALEIAEKSANKMRERYEACHERWSTAFDHRFKDSDVIPEHKKRASKMDDARCFIQINTMYYCFIAVLSVIMDIKPHSSEDEKKLVLIKIAAHEKIFDKAEKELFAIIDKLPQPQSV